MCYAGNLFSLDCCQYPDIGLRMVFALSMCTVFSKELLNTVS